MVATNVSDFNVATGYWEVGKKIKLQIFQYVSKSEAQLVPFFVLDSSDGS
ncbi:hypothetical protein CCACVL1_16017 [Corchorus capsularis]|uniref:Uncharacterized protein n=1 Tax=Corchorus capsularis TaxID=210143 RepID=A0A1R3HZT2_COCAP|nr:hypothetical protein CCACVL1_16017 [Corchorus capsularis]